MRPGTPDQNQLTRELISPRKTSHKHNNKDPTESPTVTEAIPSGGVYILCIYTHAR